jgi:nitronate monooxygenase
LIEPSEVKAILAGGGEDTERSHVSDIARGSAWPARYTARTLRTPFFDEWYGREDELAADTAAQRAYRDDKNTSEATANLVWASQAIDLITDLSPAFDLVSTLVAQAVDALAKASSLKVPPA